MHPASSSLGIEVTLNRGKERVHHWLYLSPLFLLLFLQLLVLLKVGKKLLSLHLYCSLLLLDPGNWNGIITIIHVMEAFYPPWYSSWLYRCWTSTKTVFIVNIKIRCKSLPILLTHTSKYQPTLRVTFLFNIHFVFYV